MKRNILHIASITHGHGDTILVSVSASGLTNKLYGWVREWWLEALPGKDIPKSKTKAIDEYFQEKGNRAIGNESYSKNAVDITDTVKKMSNRNKEAVVDMIEDYADSTGVNNHSGYEKFMSAVRDGL